MNLRECETLRLFERDQSRRVREECKDEGVTIRRVRLSYCLRATSPESSRV